MKRPRWIDSDVRVRGLTSRSAVWRLISGSAPVTGTVPGTGAIGRAYGLMLRWCRMVANQSIRCTTSSGLHARTDASASTARAARGLRTSHLLGARAAEQRFDLPRPSPLARDEDSELVVREACVVGDRSQAPRGEQCVEEDPENCR